MFIWGFCIFMGGSCLLLVFSFIMSIYDYYKPEIDYFFASKERAEIITNYNIEQIKNYPSKIIYTRPFNEKVLLAALRYHSDYKNRSETLSWILYTKKKVLSYETQLEIVKMNIAFANYIIHPDKRIQEYVINNSDIACMILLEICDYLQLKLVEMNSDNIIYIDKPCIDAQILAVRDNPKLLYKMKCKPCKEALNESKLLIKPKD